MNFQIKEFAETTEDPHSMDKRLTLSKLNTDSGGAVSTGFAAVVVDVVVVTVVVLVVVVAAAASAAAAAVVVVVVVVIVTLC